MLNVAALSYVLRTGVIYHSDSPFRTVQARIDTVLFHRLRAAETRLNKLLQTIIWRSYGRLTRQQQFPVAYVLWQLMRLICMRASHLINLRQHVKDDTRYALAIDADKISHYFDLLLSTHTALFRSNSPILLDFTSRFHADLLGGDEELISHAIRLREIVKRFREVSYARKFRACLAFRKPLVDSLRGVFSGAGLTSA